VKTLYLIRHAKSSWNIPALSDIDRPLNERGYTDAHEMAKRIRKKIQNNTANSSGDILISSPAIRATSTALIFARTFAIDASRIHLHPLLYDTSSKQYIAVITALSDEFNNAFLFGHNPVITETANLLGGTQLADMATCGIVGIEFDSRTWKQAAQTGGKLIFYDFPKNDGD
jgi:phosphohistidine phosphatase